MDSNRRGIALIVVLALMAVLSATGIAFVSLNSMERRISENHLDQVRARLAARSGVDTAIAAIWARIECGDLLRITGADKAPNRAGTPVAIVEEPLAKSGAREAWFRAVAWDAGSRIHVNDGAREGGQSPISLNLARILNILGDLVGVPGAGSRLVSTRPRGGYRARSEVERVLGSGDWKRIGRFLTLDSWVDAGVIGPVALSPDTASAYPVDYGSPFGAVRTGRTREARAFPLLFAPDFARGHGIAHAVMGLDELVPKWVPMCARAPVNVNLAPREVLIALIQDLRGWFRVERKRGFPSGPDAFLSYPAHDGLPGGATPDEVGFLYSTPSISGETALAIADRILEARPFGSWGDFHAFCDGLVGHRGPLRDDRPIFFEYSGDAVVASEEQARLAAQAMADVLKANFNPNYTPNELNPDGAVALLVDKADLICHSTEFSLTPMGIFDIESEGRILKTGSPDDIAIARVECSVRLFDACRESSQADFARGQFMAASAGGDATGSGTSLECGPEPDAGDRPTCRVSGWIQPATLGGREGGGAPKNGAVAVGHFRGTADLDYHAGDRRKALRTCGQLKNRADWGESAGGPYVPGRGLHSLARTRDVSAGAGAPGDLRIDGAYVERGSSLVYACTPEVFDRCGTVSYWVKPSYFPETAGKPRTLFSMDTLDPHGRWMVNGQWFIPMHRNRVEGRQEDIGGAFPYGPWPNGYFAAGFNIFKDPEFGFASAGRPETKEDGERDASRRPEGGDLSFKPHKWIHVLYAWDMDNARTRLHINGTLVPEWPVTLPIPHLPEIQDPALFARDNCAFRLGEPSVTTALGRASRNWSADATIDEFHLWKGVAEEKALELFRSGRYTREVGEFVSGPLEWSLPRRRLAPSPGKTGIPSLAKLVRILDAHVTWYPESYPGIPPPPPKPTPARPADPVQRGGGGSGPVVAATGPPPRPLVVSLALVIQGNESPDFLAGPVAPFWIDAGDCVQYRLKLGAPGPSPDAAVYGIPIVDDITVFYASGDEFLAYESAVAR